MRFYVGVTDNSWYEYLARLQPEEVNFWRPGARGLRAIEVGAPFLFKLHSPLNFIAGGGFFLTYQQLPLNLAWDTFREENGTASLSALRSLIQEKRKDGNPNPDIGCIILNEPFFLPREYWVPAPGDWKPNIVSGKGYSTRDEIGQRLWQQVTDAVRFASASAGQGRVSAQLATDQPLFGRAYLTRARLGQRGFRIQIVNAYARRCAVTGERALPALQAAHIKPVSEEGPNRTENGLLLRADLHGLFDQGYVTVTRDLHLEVSRRIKDDFDNGREYYPLHGQRLVVLPRVEEDRPSDEFLGWHNERVYLG